MNNNILSKLKSLQKERGKSSPFQSHTEFQKWADAVSPLLSFDSELRASFDQCILSANVNNGLYGEKYSYESLNNAIGILNQAISLLEINPIPNSTPQPTIDDSNNKHDWHNKPLGRIAIGVIVVILGVVAVWVINHYFGLDL